VIVGLDHVVVAVRDLGERSATFRDDLGFVVVPGGRHADLGSENALIALGDAYLELLAVTDAERTRQGLGGRGSGLAEGLARGEGALTFALRSDDLDADLARLERHGASVFEPPPGHRDRPDGVRLHWRYAAVGDGPLLLTGAPFIIQWLEGHAGVDTRTVQPHPNGAERIAGIEIATPALSADLALYRDGFGLPVVDADDDEARLLAGGTEVRLVAASVAQLRRLWVEVADLDAAVAVLTDHGVAVERSRDGDRAAAHVPADASAATALSLVEA
jgi:catechol 2,3-dioxygenase-like lactoylglutathione lyase family enzyme